MPNPQVEAPISPSTTKATFPDPNKLSQIIERYDGLDARQQPTAAFAKYHGAMLDGTKEVLRAVEKYGEEIPTKVASVLGERIRHLLNAENMVFETCHHGARWDLTRAAETSLNLVLTSPTSEMRTQVARLGLMTIDSLQSTLRDA